MIVLAKAGHLGLYARASMESLSSWQMVRQYGFLLDEYLHKEMVRAVTRLKLTHLNPRNL